EEPCISSGSHQNPYNLLNSDRGISLVTSIFWRNITTTSPDFGPAANTTGSKESPSLTLACERTGPGLALDGGFKFDLLRLNQDYFDQLRAAVVQAAERGVYVGSSIC